MTRKNPLTILTLAFAFALALPLASCATVNGQETAGQYTGDSAVTARVKANIVKEQSLKGFEIGVETMQGTVQLSGFVSNRTQKDQAAQIASNTDGVKGVQNNIIVKQ